MLESYFAQYELSLFQRMLFIWAFIVSALVVSLQISQSWVEPRPRWTVLTNRSKPYWYTYYTFVAFLFMQISYRPLRWNLEGMLGGIGVPVLDALWIGLLGLEAVMIVYVLLLRISGAMKKDGKIKEL